MNFERTKMRIPKISILFLLCCVPAILSLWERSIPADSSEKNQSRISPQESPEQETPNPLPDTPPMQKLPGEKDKITGLMDFFTDIFSKEEDTPETIQMEKARQSYFRGQLYLQQNKNGQALRHFEDASSLDPKALKPRLQMARCYLLLNQDTKAVKICNEILKENTDYIPALLLLAKTQQAKNQYQDAEKTYNRILSIQPNHLQSLSELGTIYYQRLGNVDKTIEVYNRILTLKRKDIMALVILGSAYAIKGDVDKSLDYYSTAIHYRSELVSSYVNLAKLFQESRNYEGAKRVYFKALMTDPENEEIIKDYQSFLRLQALRKYGIKKAEEMQKSGEASASLSLKDLARDKELRTTLEKEILEGYRELAEDQATTSTALIALYADALVRYERYEAAKVQYEKILTLDPENFKAQVALGNIALLQGNQQGAIEAFDRAIAINPDNTEVYSHIGAVYLDQKDYTRALDLYEKAAQAKPDEDKIQLILVAIYEKLKMDTRAEEILIKLTQNNPKRTDLHVIMGDFYRQREQYAESLASFEKAYELKNNSQANSSMVLTLLLELEKNQEAKIFAQQAAENLKRKKEFLIFAGLSFSNFGLFDDALHFLEMARDIEPMDISAYAFIAGAYNKKKEYGKAIELFENLRDTLPTETKSAEYYEMLATIYMDQRNYKKADDALIQAASIDPQRESIYVTRASLAIKEKDNPKAETILNDALKIIDRNSEKGMLLEAQILSNLKKYERAEPLYNLLYKKDPENMDYAYNLGLLYYEAERFDEAEKLLRKVLDKETDRAEAYNNLGYMFAEQGKNLDEAEDLLKRALYLRPGTSYMIDSLAWIYYKKGFYDKALKFLLRAENLSLDDAILFDHIGDTYDKLGNPKKARDYWKKSWDLDPDIKGLKEKLNK